MRRSLFACLLALPLAALAGSPGTTTLKVRNMDCPVCPLTVKLALEKVPGVHAVKVDFERKTATVVYDVERTGPQAFVAASTAAGYPATIADGGQMRAR